jgi:hypothetical protein
MSISYRPAGSDARVVGESGRGALAGLDATKKYQFTHPIAATPAATTSQSVPDIRSSCGVPYPVGVT